MSREDLDAARAMRRYRRLLSLLPAAFREEASEEMSAIFLDAYEAARRSGSRRGIAALWIRVFTDTLVSLIGAWGGRLLDVWMSSTTDLRLAVRHLLKNPTFSAVALTALALGVGGTTAMFSIVDGVLIRNLPYERPGSLVSVWKAWPSWRGDQDLDDIWDRIQFPWEDYLSVRDGSSGLAAVAAHGHAEVILETAAEVEVISAGEASANLFSTLGVRPALGRTFSEAEVPPEGEGQRVAVLSHELWSRRFQRRSDVLGESVRVSGETFEIIGVLPADFRLVSELVTHNDGQIDDGLRDLWVPLQVISKPRENDFEIIGRLSEGWTVAQAQAEIQPLLIHGPSDQFARVIPRKSVVTDGFAAPLILLFSAAGVLTLIACTNVTSMLVGRAIDRQHEFAVRAALGAGRARIVRQLLMESALLGALGAGLGVAVAAAGTEAMLAIAPRLPRIEEVGLNPRVLLFSGVTGVSVGILFGIVPALLLGREARAATIRTRQRTPRTTAVQRVVVSIQVGMTVVLLSTGVLFGRTLIQVMSLDPGFEPHGLTTFSLRAPVGVTTREDLNRLYDDVLATVRGVGGVIAASAATDLPFPATCCENSVELLSDGIEVTRTHHVRRVSPGYVETLRIPVLQGRSMQHGDGFTRPVAVLVSQSLADLNWPSEPAIGRRISWDGSGDLVVAGVVGDVRQRSLSSEVAPTIYIPLAYQPKDQLGLVMRVSGDPTSVVGAALETLRASNREVPIGQPQSLIDLIRDSEADSRFRATLVSVLALVATVLSASGIFGVTSRMVALRRREIGIRTTLGASHYELMTMVFRRGLPATAAGIGFGLIGALLAGELVESHLYGVSAQDPSTYLWVAALALGVSLLATYVPARRVLRIAPHTVVSEE